MKRMDSKPAKVQTAAKRFRAEVNYHSRICQLQIGLAALGVSSILAGGLCVLESHGLASLRSTHLAQVLHMAGLLLLTISVLPLARLLRRKRIRFES